MTCATCGHTWLSMSGAGTCPACGHGHDAEDAPPIRKSRPSKRPRARRPRGGRGRTASSGAGAVHHHYHQPEQNIGALVLAFAGLMTCGLLMVPAFFMALGKRDSASVATRWMCVLTWGGVAIAIVCLLFYGVVLPI